MKKVIVRLIVAAALVMAAEGFNRAAAVERALATAQERLATLRAPVAATAVDPRVEDTLGLAARLPLVGTPLLADLRAHEATAAYWTGDYASLLAPASPDDEDAPDPGRLILSTNAAYRSLLLTTTDREALVRGLDDVLRGYGEVLQEAPGRVDAAYNYEFVARLRDAISRGGRVTELTEAQTSMHGEPGEPPEGNKAPDFNVIVPMRPEERQDQFEAGSGAAPVRKG